MLYLYAKRTERIDVFEPIFDALNPAAADLTFCSEHELSWHVLDDTIGALSSGDGLCVPDLSHLGVRPGETAARLGRILSKHCRGIICAVPSTYEFGTDPLLNEAVISTILQAMSYGPTNAQPFMTKPSVGRPKTTFPPGWDELYARWEKAEITSKEFLIASGLKKATFYNKLSDYQELIAFNDLYLAEHGIA